MIDINLSPWLPTIAIAAVALKRHLDPNVKPTWISLPEPWRSIAVAALGLLAAALTAHAAGNDWPMAVAMALGTIATAGGLDHGLPTMASPANKAIDAAVDKAVATSEAAPAADAPRPIAITVRLPGTVSPEEMVTRLATALTGVGATPAISAPTEAPAPEAPGPVLDSAATKAATASADSASPSPTATVVVTPPLPSVTT